MGEFLDAAAFFKLVDAVLVAARRGALKPGGPEHQVITVRPSDRVLQILAGPGSGKTEMLVWRVLYELLVLGTRSDRVMVTTFTRRAATELQVRVVERCESLLQVARAQGLDLPDPKVHDLRIGTIHSLCDALLAEFDTTYLESGTQLVDETEISIRIARDHRWALGFNNPPAPARVLNRLLSNQALTVLFRPPWEDGANWPASTMARVSCIAGLLSQHTETWLPRCASARRPNGIEKVHGATGLTEDLCKLQQRWEEYLDKNQLLDFTTIQKRFLERQATIAERIDHIFVDEFQDNNPIQFALHTGWLARPTTRLTVVGDDDQAIYRFRGSDIECFNRLGPFCAKQKIPYRVEKLEVNYRSTKAIVSFCQQFKKGSVLERLSMQKQIVPARSAPKGEPIRLLQGDWPALCEVVAAELDKLGAGKIPREGEPAPPSAAILIFSTSERSTQNHDSAALTLRRAIQARNLRIYNPRNKTAASPESPVSQLFGLLSYLIDPISMAPAGKNGRQVMVAASMPDHQKRRHARSHPPEFRISEQHLGFQKRLIKDDGGEIGAPSPARKPLLDLADATRTNLVNSAQSGKKPRLTLAGFVARVLSLPHFRNCGFTPELFRQALFTSLLEANVAPTRLTMDSLDIPLEVSLQGGRFLWPKRFWSLLNVFGGYLADATLDDPEIESFEENSILMITFHQGKGLEFDHIYVAGTGRPPDLAPALRTRLFSGEPTHYEHDGALSSRDTAVNDLALADREREVYVAMTRARKRLTLLHDPGNDFAYMPLNPAIASLFGSGEGRAHPGSSSVKVKEWSHE
jgi:DNA helicase-2/ATP-dependent DNA helicase PcrA